MQGLLGRNLVLGFIAAAIAVITVHQSIVYLLNAAGLVRFPAWSFSPVPPFGVPRLINGMFWGGLFGALYSMIHQRLPGGTALVKGLIYGLLIVIFSNWLLVPFVKGTLIGLKDQPYFAGFDAMRMLMSVIIQMGFGAATALIYRVISGRS